MPFRHQDLCARTTSIACHQPDACFYRDAIYRIIHQVIGTRRDRRPASHTASRHCKRDCVCTSHLRRLRSHIFRTHTPLLRRHFRHTHASRVLTRLFCALTTQLRHLTCVSCAHSFLSPSHLSRRQARVQCVPGHEPPLLRRRLARGGGRHR